MPKSARPVPWIATVSAIWMNVRLPVANALKAVSKWQVCQCSDFKLHGKSFKPRLKIFVMVDTGSAGKLAVNQSSANGMATGPLGRRINRILAFT